MSTPRLATFVGINEAPKEPVLLEGGKTVEARVEEIKSRYKQALRLMTPGQETADLAAAAEQAQSLLKAVLADPLVEATSNPTRAERRTTELQSLAYLTRKNLAALLAQHDSTAHEALLLYTQATASCLADEDAELLHAAGTLAAELSLWHVARPCLEAAVATSPHNVLLREALLEVLLAVRDWEAAADTADALCGVDTWHPRARETLRALHPAGGGSEGAAGG